MVIPIHQNHSLKVRKLMLGPPTEPVVTLGIVSDGGIKVLPIEIKEVQMD